MSCPFSSLTNISRRRFFTLAGGIGLAAAGGLTTKLVENNGKLLNGSPDKNSAEAFFGSHQAGITTYQQDNSYFASFDLVTEKRDDVIKLLQDWTKAAARMTQGQTAEELSDNTEKPSGDSGEALGINPSHLTITFGFGAGLFTKNGVDRYGLAAKRPAALVDMPKFNGDQLVDEKSGGDISVQACANDPQVAFHAIRQLARMAENIAVIRWTKTGFISRPENGATPRNLQGFKDGTQNPKGNDIDKFVWINEGPDWLKGGSYLVVRSIRMALEHWDKTEVSFQEQVIGRHKYSGAPLGQKDEFETPNLKAVDKDGNFIIPDNAHLRLSTAASNDGAQILRRGYSYNDGVNFTSERWPPWRQGMEYDAGLFFVCYQRDPREGFIKIFKNMAKVDALNQFATHTSSAIFVVPAGVREGKYIGQNLFETI